jgi:hypothetical protein
LKETERHFSRKYFNMRNIVMGKEKSEKYYIWRGLQLHVQIVHRYFEGKRLSNRHR